MEHKILRMNNEQQAQAKETRVPKGQGVIFIKTRMSDDKIHALVAEMLEVAEATDVEVIDIIVDELAGGDIDRESVDRLSDWIENSGVGIIFVKSITDISNDADDLDKFIGKAMYFGMIIMDFSENVIISPFKCEEIQSWLRR
jgi:type 1 glutamine amidotransferase